MIEKLTVNGKEITFTANAFTPIQYEEDFDSNYFEDMETIGKYSIENNKIDATILKYVYRFAYTYYKQALDNEKDALSYKE